MTSIETVNVQRAPRNAPVASGCLFQYSRNMLLLFIYCIIYISNPTQNKQKVIVMLD